LEGAVREFVFRGLSAAATTQAIRLGVATSAMIILASQAQAGCTVPVAPGGYGWSPKVVCSAVEAGTGLATLNTSLAIDFFTFASPFVTSPSGTTPNTVQSGVWVRGVGGESTTTTNISASLTKVPGVAVPGSSTLRTGYAGFQTGIDSGLLNLGGGGWNAHVGVTFGEEWASPNLSDGSERYSSPFLGLYAVFTKESFFASLQVRHGWQDIGIDNAELGLSGANLSANSWDFSSAAGYRFDINSFFIEPSAGLDLSTTNVDSLAVPNGSLSTVGVPPGTLTLNHVQSTLGFAGARIGTAFSTSTLAIQPYVTASVWRQFDGNMGSQYTCASATQCPLGAATASASQIGTFGRFGVGVAAQVLNTGLVSYARADVETGSNYSGWTLSGGLRYSF
jgi:uncharacterized protein YhjY with autotransporter beta-barrel domain